MGLTIIQNSTHGDWLDLRSASIGMTFQMKSVAFDHLAVKHDVFMRVDMPEAYADVDILQCDRYWIMNLRTARISYLMGDRSCYFVKLEDVVCKTPFRET